MKLNEDEIVEKDPIIQIYADIMKLMRGKVEVDYQDDFKTTFGIILNSVVEVKYSEEQKYLSLKFYKEPNSDEVQNLNLTNFAQPYFSNFEYIFAESSKEISTLFSFSIVEPKTEVTKVIINNRNINDYKELLNTSIEIFNDFFGITNGSK